MNFLIDNFLGAMVKLLKFGYNLGKESALLTVDFVKTQCSGKA